MRSLRQWQNEINEGGNKAKVTAHTLLAAETAAHRTYDAKVREMTYSNKGVTPHGGNNEKMIVSQVLSLLARGWDDLFKKTAQEYSNRASQNPVRYAPLRDALREIAHVLDQPRP